MPTRADSLRGATDEELLVACLRGEQPAWNALIDRYSALIYSIPLKYRLSEADAGDVFQAVCITLLENLGSIRAPRGIAAWIITTTSRQCLAVARRRRQEQLRSTAERFAPDAIGLPDPDHLPEEELLALERQQFVRTAMSQLPDSCRRLIQSLFSDVAQPTSYQALARELGVPMNSLGPTRGRCLDKLRQLLEAAGYSP